MTTLESSPDEADAATHEGGTGDAVRSTSEFLLYKQAVAFHKQAADFFERGAAFDHLHGWEELAGRLEQDADKAREAAELNQEVADRVRDALEREGCADLPTISAEDAPTSIEGRAERHRSAAARHASAAEQHEAAASFWAERDAPRHAALERRAAEIERQAAKLEHDYATFVERQDS